MTSNNNSYGKSNYSYWYDMEEEAYFTKSGDDHYFDSKEELQTTTYGSTAVATTKTTSYDNVVNTDEENVRGETSNPKTLYFQQCSSTTDSKDTDTGTYQSNDNEYAMSESMSMIINNPPTPSSSPNNNSNSNSNNKNSMLRRIAIDLSLYLNLIILFSKLYAYITTLSLSVLAALTDSLLDVVSQIVLNYTERHSSKSRSSALYPAGAARLEPLGVLTCAALMGMASFEILKESMESIWIHGSSTMNIIDDDNVSSSVYGMLGIVFVKLGLYFLCHYAIPYQTHSNSIYTSTSGASVSKQSLKVSDPTLEALAQDHWNDALSNSVAAIALFAAYLAPDLWFLDPIGAIMISIYIIYSWYETGKEQIEQLTGKSAPDEFIDELHALASNFDKRMIVDVVRAYHFGPKFLVELEVVLPKDTLLFESHDLGMELQYEIEGREEVERCFVHIDYEQRPYDEHVVSKVPELRAKYRPSANSSYCHSV
jgi:cation diffusion facilitator family transporter